MSDPRTVKRSDIVAALESAKTDGWHDTIPEEIRQTGPSRIEFRNMYEYISMGPRQIMALSGVFGTDQWNLDQWSSPGCETCDYGSQYVHVLDFPWPITLEGGDA